MIKSRAGSAAPLTLARNPNLNPLLRSIAATCRSLVTVAIMVAALNSHAWAAEKREVKDPANSKPSNQFGVELGDSLAVCRAKIRLQAVSTREFLSDGLFAKRFGFLRPETTIVWSDQKPRPNGWPTYVIGAFGNSAKTNLTDLLRIGDGHKFALVEGNYSKALAALKKGMTVEQMFALVGQHECEYTRDSEGRRIVQFFYQGFLGRQYYVEADAATGVILKAFDGTI
ncbi:MAG: hypothetical protein ABMA26_24580 [Limisphaerales bacterium]